MKRLLLVILLAVLMFATIFTTESFAKRNSKILYSAKGNLELCNWREK